MKVFGWHPLLLFIGWVMAVLFVNLLNFYGPRLEGKLWPVAVSTETNVLVMSENILKVWGTFSKTRDCELLGRTVYIEDPVGNKIIATIEVAGPVSLRPVGDQYEWGPWTVKVPSWYRQATFTAITVHQCHPLWQTQTTFLTKML